MKLIFWFCPGGSCGICCDSGFSGSGVVPGSFGLGASGVIATVTFSGSVVLGSGLTGFLCGVQLLLTDL